MVDQNAVKRGFGPLLECGCRDPTFLARLLSLRRLVETSGAELAGFKPVLRVGPGLAVTLAVVLDEASDAFGGASSRAELAERLLRLVLEGSLRARHAGSQPSARVSSRRTGGLAIV